MRLSNWISILLLLLVIDAQSQQLRLGDGDFDYNQLPFRESFISANRIGEIEVATLIKRSNQAIKESGHSILYTFNTDGTLESLITFRNLAGRRDSILESYGISPANYLPKAYTRRDNRGVYKEEYSIENDTIVIQKFRGSEERLESLAQVDTEYLVKQKSEFEDVQLLLNANKLPYQKTTHQYDSNGYLVYKKEEWLVSRKVKETNYGYNELGRMSNRSGKRKDSQWQWVYEYDATGALHKIFHRRDGKLEWRKEILYNEQGFMDAIITKDERSEDIKIERFSYSLK